MRGQEIYMYKSEHGRPQGARQFKYVQCVNMGTNGRPQGASPTIHCVRSTQKRHIVGLAPCGRPGVLRPTLIGYCV